MIIDRVRDTIEQHYMVSEGAHVIIGLSGGPDSVCLFDLLCRLRDEKDLVLHAVHVNHRLRPGAAEEDAEYVKRLCMSRNVECRVFEYDINMIAADEGTTSEEAGRKARYESFNVIAEELTASGVHKENICIAVAHNRNDQAETVLFRIIRGTGTDGLRGMDYVRKNENGIRIIRPVLDISREEIENYCKGRGLEPRIDETNLHPLYSRNKVRLSLIPYIDEMFGGDIKGALVRLSENAGEDSEYIDLTAEEVFRKAERISDSRIKIASDALNGIHSAVLKRVISKCFSDIGLVQDITKKQLDAALDLIGKNRTSSRIDFPHGYRLRLGYGCVIAEKENSCEAPEYTEKSIEIDWGRLCDEYLEKTGRRPDRKDILQRTRIPGDYIIFGNNTEFHRKKLKKFFTDEKIPEEVRDSIPVFAIGSEILWIVGSGEMKDRINAKYVVGPHTEETVRLTLMPGCEKD